MAATAWCTFVYSAQHTGPAEHPGPANWFFYKNLQWLYVGSWVPHIFIDVMLLGLPVPLLWGLQMQSKRKIILTAIFAVGGL